MSNKSIFISLILLLALFTAPQKAIAQVSFQIFYDQLSPYGTWVDDPEYGYVWIPEVESGFTPYASNGYWVLTDYGWTWVSDYPWGWAPFHYGRWFNDPFYGPMWLPDYEWGPGWVDWRRSNSYYGWAPLPPARGRGHHRDDDHWVFVRNQDFGRRDVHNYYVQPSRTGRILPYSRAITNNHQDNDRHVTYNAGPDRAEVEKRSGRTIAPATLRDRNEPGQEVSNDQVQIYRPRVQKSGTEGSKPAPANVANLKDVKQRAPAVNTSKNAQSTRGREPQTTQKTTNARQRATSENPPAATIDRTQRNQPAQKTQPTRRETTPQQQASPSTRQRTTPAPTNTPPRQRTAPTPRSAPADNQQRTQQPAQNAAPARQREMPAQRPAPSASPQRSQPAPGNATPNHQRQGNPGNRGNKG